MINFKAYIFFVMLFVAEFNLWGQIYPYNFRSISIDNGLSQSTVYSITQDTLGFIWMATQDGLNRYDGYAFTVYHPINGDANSLQSNYLKSTFLDSDGHVWIGGDRGVSKYNHLTNQFINYKPVRKFVGEWFVSAITEGKDKSIWIGTNSGEIFVIDATKGTIKQFFFDSIKYGIKSINCLKFYNDRLYIATNVGLYTKTPNTNRLYKVKFDSEVSPSSVNDIMIDNSTLWIATEGNGLFNYNLRTKTVNNYLHEVGNAQSLANNDVRGISKDATGNIWIGTFKGLSVLHKDSKQFQNYYHQLNSPYTISQNSIRSIFKDRQGGMWLGTYYGGVNYYHSSDLKFNNLNQNMGKVSLNDQVVNTIKQDKGGSFWIGTNDKGLNHWNPKTNSISYYTHNEANKNSLSSNNIKSLVFDEKDRLLLGTHNSGLNILDVKSGKFTVLKKDPKNDRSIAGDMVYALLKDHKSRIWVGTRTGFDFFDSKNNTFKHILLDAAGKRLSSDEISFLMEDSKNRIWIGTTNGVNQFYPESDLFNVFQGSMLSNEVVNCITEDPKKRIWIATRYGLNLFDEAHQTFISFKERPEFPQGTIYGLLTDEVGNLWFSSNNGLGCFNPETKETKWFDTNDGLQSKQFNIYAFCKAKDGMMLFGGINGLSYFYPKTISQSPLKLKLSFTGLELFDKIVIPNDENDILSAHIDRSTNLILKHDQKQFSIIFNTFNYISASRTKYTFRLKGFDTKWYFTNSPKVTYSNLGTGEYVFEVKAIGPSGEMSTLRTINIEILPAWYASSLFLCSLFLLILSFGYVVYRNISERIITLEQLKQERIERDKINYINQVKTDFFTNISHELRTPLTLILAPLEEIMSKPVNDNYLKNQYRLMLSNTRKLYHLVNQLFEFRKAEAGTLKLCVEKSDLVTFVKEIYNSFKPIAERKDISYDFISSEMSIITFFDKDVIGKILFNLLSNAFKYTDFNGKIKIELIVSSKNVVIKVYDNGIGIQQEYLEKIFERFYQIDAKETNLGSGIGLAFTKYLTELHHGRITVDSVCGLGSTFSFEFPLDSTVYQNDMLRSNGIIDASFEDTWIPKSGLLLDENWGENVQLPQKETILIVDDNSEILNYLARYFQQFYHVITASNGNQALTELNEKQIDLIISDIMMAELDGINLCIKIKKNIQTSHIPIILLTARAETEQQIKGIEVGADDYITKPFSIKLLSIKVQNILHSRKRLKEYYSASKDIIPENVAFNILDEKFLKQAMRIIEENLSESDFSVEKLSREIGMSRSNLYLKVRAITGESVTDFIKRIRFKKAIELLEEKQYTIAQIAYMSGFNSPSYFSTAFKQYHGCMPTEYLAKTDLDINQTT
ncbi:two-component regulator propeller domain-containing protein [Arcicella rosea]|uniref:histidine kinase n=1 Tax=Arcicella rosea TaxID=502909 RepID=A0A841EHT6_9BACT|nr:two-component regulator propeller domain-containing protein [Arcicella rosea]MBB6002546.1 signal transduction histidine kinase/ligand-binding sensor domain-containing protein/DNA-binding response OmpR family regulator [Arcicella rosea]